MQEADDHAFVALPPSHGHASTKTVFGDLSTAAGLRALDTFLADRSYIEGFLMSCADAHVLAAIPPGCSPPPSLCHALRWYNHIRSFPAHGLPPAQSRYILDEEPGAGHHATPCTGDDDDDDIDLFGSDDEEDRAAASRLKQQRLAEYAARKSAKPPPVAKSSILLDVKPWDDQTDMARLEACVRSVRVEGLLWGASKLVAVGYGIRKLQISCVVEDDKVGTDLLEEHITAFEELVQSMDVVAFNKI